MAGTDLTGTLLQAFLLALLACFSPGRVAGAANESANALPATSGEVLLVSKFCSLEGFSSSEVLPQMRAAVAEVVLGGAGPGFGVSDSSSGDSSVVRSMACMCYTHREPPWVRGQCYVCMHACMACDSLDQGIPVLGACIGAL